MVLFFPWFNNSVPKDDFSSSERLTDLTRWKNVYIYIKNTTGAILLLHSNIFSLEFIKHYFIVLKVFLHTYK